MIACNPFYYLYFSHPFFLNFLLFYNRIYRQRRTKTTFILIKAVERLRAAQIRADIFIDVSSKSINSIPHYANSAARASTSSTGARGRDTRSPLLVAFVPAVAWIRSNKFEVALSRRFRQETSRRQWKFWRLDKEQGISIFSTMEFPELVNRKFLLTSWTFNYWSFTNICICFVHSSHFFIHFSILEMILRIKIKKNLYGDSSPWRWSPEQGSTYPLPRRCLDSFALSRSFRLYSLYNSVIYVIYTLIIYLCR